MVGALLTKLLLTDRSFLLGASNVADPVVALDVLAASANSDVAAALENAMPLGLRIIFH